MWGQCSGGWEGRRNPKAVVPGLTKGCSGCSVPSPRSLWVTCHSSGLSAEPAAQAAGRRGFSQEQARGAWKNGLIPSRQPVPTLTVAFQGATLPSAAGRRQRKNGDIEWASPGASALPEDTVCIIASGSFLLMFPEGPLGNLFFTSFSSLLSSYCVLIRVLRVCREEKPRPLVLHVCSEYAGRSLSLNLFMQLKHGITHRALGTFRERILAYSADCTPRLPAPCHVIN